MAKIKFEKITFRIDVLNKLCILIKKISDLTKSNTNVSDIKILEAETNACIELIRIFKKIAALISDENKHNQKSICTFRLSISEIEDFVISEILG